MGRADLEHGHQVHLFPMPVPEPVGAVLVAREAGTELLHEVQPLPALLHQADGLNHEQHLGWWWWWWWW